MSRLMTILVASRRGALCAVLCLGLIVVPQIALAGCGDYVMVNGHAAGAGSVHAVIYRAVDSPFDIRNLATKFGRLVGSLPDFQQQKSYFRQISNQALPGHTPCRGPACSDQSQQHTVPIPPVTMSVQQWALHSCPGQATGHSQVAVITHTNDLIAGECRLSILRPPRS